MGLGPGERWRDLGEFIREQRNTARLSLRRLSELAGISNPYLSQIERGLRRPSAEILRQLSKALRISAESLYVRAGILEDVADDGDLVEAIRADRHLGRDQQEALVRVYLAFRAGNAEPGEGELDAAGSQTRGSQTGGSEAGVSEAGVSEAGVSHEGVPEDTTPGLASSHR